MIDKIGDAISGFFWKILYNVMKMLGDVLDTIVDLMRMLLGLKDVDGGEDLVLGVLTNEVVIMTFLIILALGLFMTFVFAIIRLVKNFLSENEKDDGTVSKQKATKGILHSVLIMVLIPVFVLALVFGITGVAKSIDSATSNGTKINYGTEIIFSVADKDLLDTKGLALFYNDTPNSEGIVVSGMQAVKEEFNRGTKSYGAFCKLVNIDKYSDKMILPLLGVCILTFSLGMACILVAQRLFYLVFLFVISPFVASTHPFDDGARWRKWCEIFISKLMSSYGIIICLNLFFLISGYLAGLKFFESSLKNGITILIIYISGGIAATGANNLIAQLIGSDAGTQERDNALGNFRSLMGGVTGARLAVKGAKGIAGKSANLLAGKKENPLANALSGSGGAKASGDSSGASGIAGKIGNALLGRTSLKAGLQKAGKGAIDSRPAKVMKGAGLLAGGLVAGVPIAIAKGGKKIKGKYDAREKTIARKQNYINQNPDTKKAEKFRNQIDAVRIRQRFPNLYNQMMSKKSK